GFFIPDRPKTKASWEEKKEIKRMHDLIDQDLEKYKENLKQSLEDEMNEYMEKAQKGIESISDEKIKAVTECGENAIGSINKNHDEVKDTLKAIESAKDEAKAEVEKTKSELDEAKDTLKAIESAKDEAKADIEKTKSELISEIEQKETEIKAEAEKVAESKAETEKVEEVKAGDIAETEERVSEAEESIKETVDVEEVISETVSDYSDDGFTGVLSDDPEDDLIKILKEGLDETETGISGETKVLSEETADSKKSKKNKRNTKKTVKRSAESISFASKNTDEILRLYKEGKSNVAIAKELGIGVGEVKLVIDLANM
ncbi:MAG: hypothetical protein IKS60_06835, partial [Lachnospiraceae bacterium]|nr:hypothetical protein [Lachnospiraceae bacterium]